MKRVAKSLFALVMVMGLVISTPTVAMAATEKASNLTELAKIVTDHGLKRESKFDVDYSGPDEDIDDLFESESYFFSSGISMYDDPSTSDDADYLVGNYNWTIPDTVSLRGSKIIFNLQYFETLPQTKYVNEHIPEITRGLGLSSMSNYDKVKTIHDYVCKLITYTNTNEDYESTVYGALYYNKALCNSYALCMYKLCVESGVPCKYIGGKAGTGRDADGHAWNIVALGDKWYSLDATWDDDDDNDSVGYDYFLKGSSDFDEADFDQPHTMDKPYRTGEFAKKFPIAKTAFKKGMDDENVKVKIGDDRGSSVEPTDPTDPTDPDEPVVEPEETYTFSDIVSSVDPKKGKISVKKGKTAYLFLNLNDGMGELIDKVTYKVVKGKGNIKSIKNYGLASYGNEEYAALTFKGKKKGAVQVKIILKLTNGQELSYTFKGKVK